ncbi:helix-turn-helix domain-containing protein [Salmonella enterica]|uniref:DNA-binding protein n=1 Tax=Salmonella enterica TaxID=28901 RepID=A0A5T8IWU0_SALER|nr:helix-turn-helix domain-containing protein [Salmonella enterica]EAZ7579919.1 helix-turn-helix domain-containing protein [Salmonella enterica subsp. enterica serovar Muenchen]ECM0177497.1 helix-turn-helix domain-containing protein [Salmonella enterica subsp. enterica serovar Give]ECM0354806.1 helix-turn-helix domain-containing protein [Salmonella enterica subsp. enterica serovar Rubislaw]ECX3462298.1 helix-turn-helix domain-containing protein [Salmonella enterica subsp. enterica serovar Litch
MNIRERMTRKEAAEYIGVSPATMAVWACTGLVKIPYYRAGAKKVIYLKSDLDSYIESTRTLIAPSRNMKKKAG